MIRYQGFAIVCDGANVFPRYYTPSEAGLFQESVSSGWDIRDGKKPLRVVGRFLWLKRSAGYFLLRDLAKEGLKRFYRHEHDAEFWNVNSYPNGYPRQVVDKELGIERPDIDLSDYVS